MQQLVIAAAAVIGHSSCHQDRTPLASSPVTMLFSNSTVLNSIYFTGNVITVITQTHQRQPHQVLPQIAINAPIITIQIPTDVPILAAGTRFWRIVTA